MNSSSIPLNVIGNMRIVRRMAVIPLVRRIIWARRPREMKRLAEEVHHPAFGFLLHLGRWKADEAEGDAMVAPWTVHTHFDAKTAVHPGAEEKVRCLLAGGYKGYWGVEYNAPNNQYVEMEWMIGAVKRIVSNASQVELE